MATYGLFTAGKMVTMLMSWDQARDSPAAINDDFVIHHLHSTLPLILTVLSKLDRGIQLELMHLLLLLRLLLASLYFGPI